MTFAWPAAVSMKNPSSEGWEKVGGWDLRLRQMPRLHVQILGSSSNASSSVSGVKLLFGSESLSKRSSLERFRLGIYCLWLRVLFFAQW